MIALTQALSTNYQSLQKEKKGETLSCNFKTILKRHDKLSKC